MQNVQVFCPHCSQVVQANAPYKDVVCPYCDQIIFFHDNDKVKLMCACGKKMTVAQKYTNRNATCPRCGADIFIPKFQMTNTPSRQDLLETFGNSAIASDNMLTSKIAVNKDKMASLAKLGLSSTDATMTSDITMQPPYLSEPVNASELNFLQKPRVTENNNNSRQEFSTEEYKLDFGDQKEADFFQAPIQENEEEQHELMLQEEEDDLKNFSKGNIVYEHGQAPYYDLVSCSPIIYVAEGSNSINPKNIIDLKSWPLILKLSCVIFVSAFIIYIFQPKSSIEDNSNSPLFLQNPALYYQQNYYQQNAQRDIYNQLRRLPQFSDIPGEHRVRDENTVYTYSIDNKKNIKIISKFPRISSDLIPDYIGTEGYHTTIQDDIVYEYQVDEFGDIIHYQKFSQRVLIDSEDIPNFNSTQGSHESTSNKIKYQYYVNDYGRIVYCIKSDLTSDLRLSLTGSLNIPEQETEPGCYTTEDEKFSYSYWIDEDHEVLSCQATQLDLDEQEEDSFEDDSEKDKARQLKSSPFFKIAQGLIKRAEEENSPYIEEIDSCLEILEHYEIYYEVNLFFSKQMKQVNKLKEEYNKKREEYEQKKQFFEDRENITQDEVQALSKQFSRYKNELEDLKEVLTNIQLAIEADPIVTALMEIENTTDKEQKLARWFWLVQYNSTIQNRLKKIWKFSSKKDSYPQEKLHNQILALKEDKSPKSLYEELSLECLEEWDVDKNGNIAPPWIIQETLELKDRSTVVGKVVSEDNQKLIITVYFNAINFNNITVKKSDIVSRKKEKVQDPLINKQAHLLLDIVKNINDKKIVEAYNKNLMWQKRCLLTLEQQRKIIWKICPYMIFSYIPTLKTPFENNLLTLKVCSQCHGKTSPCSNCENTGIVSNDSYAKFVVTLMNASKEKE